MNFSFLQRKRIRFYTVLKEYTDEFKVLIRSVNSRTAGRKRLQQGVWVTEVTSISLPKYLKTKQLRCFVMRMKGKKPWAVITNDESADKCWVVSFYLKRNKVEKAIQELKPISGKEQTQLKTKVSEKDMVNEYVAYLRENYKIGMTSEIKKKNFSEIVNWVDNFEKQ